MASTSSISWRLFSPFYLCLIILSFLTAQSNGFMPFDWRETHLGAAGVSHKAMTRKAYEHLAKEFWPDIPKLTGTMIRARDTWSLANGRVDEELSNSGAHCDGENFEECNGLILKYRQDVIDALQAKQKKALAAQQSLGRALHPLQDFYSHSNWIEMNDGPVVHPKLGMTLRYPGEKPIPNTDPDISTCTLCQPHKYTGDELLCQAKCMVGDGFTNMFDQLAMANLSLPIGWTSFILGGLRALPSVVLREYCREDCVCHDCSKGAFTDVLTSGYSAEELGVRPIPTKNKVFKCVHGGHTDALGRTLDGKFGGLAYIDPLYQEAYDGINKDSLDCTWSPHGPKWHKAAVEAATNATIKMVREIAKEVTPLELKLLFGVGPSIAFAIDTTASMKQIIATVAAEVVNIVDHRIGEVDEPSLYVLAEINDPAPTVWGVKSEVSVSRFKFNLLGLGASGGKDCEAYSMTGALNALSHLGNGGDLFIVTDSKVKDRLAEFEVIKLAQRKSIRIWPFIFSGCGPPDPAFERIAMATQGKAFVNLSLTDAARVTKIADDLVRSNTVSILSSEVNFFSSLTMWEEYVLDDLRLIDALILINKFHNAADLALKLMTLFGLTDWVGGKPWKSVQKIKPSTNWWRRRDSATSGETLSYFIPVDSSMSQLSFQLTGNASISRVLKPDGTPLPQDDPSISVIMVNDGAIATIRKPYKGFWLLSLDVQDDFSLSVSGISDLHFSRFAFAKIRGRPGHDGFDDIDGEPETGVDHPVLATIEGDISDCMFACCSPNGMTMQNYTLFAGGGGFGEPMKNSHFGTVRVPEGPFHNYVYGFDASGAPYQRVFHGGSVTPLPTRRRDITNTTKSSNASEFHKMDGPNTPPAPP
jgi:hypothetical protein